MMSYFAVTATAVTACFLAYLVLCAIVVICTGTTTGLRDVAAAVRAFPLRPIHTASAVDAEQR
jgi:hypothetical protein